MNADKDHCDECEEILELLKEKVFSIGGPFVVDNCLDTWTFEQIISS